MEYFRLLNLKREPFSNAADPDFFFKSRQHLDCLQQLELSIRNRRGMNVVLGDVGTGKTTLSHQLIRQFRNESKIETHLILNPDFRSTKDFLILVVQLLVGKRPSNRISGRALKDFIRRYLSRKVLVEKKTIALILDEGQKLPVHCLEIIREFLNFERSENKLLQIVIFAQQEFELNLVKYVNFTDRINLYFILDPLDFKETRKMIRFRLRQSTGASNVSESAKAPSLFSYPGQFAIYTASGGYPRKIVNLCHHCLIKIIVRQRPKAGWFTVRSCLKQTIVKRSKRLLRFEFAMVTAAFLAAALIAGPAYHQLQQLRPWLIESVRAINPQEIIQWVSGDPEPDEPPPPLLAAIPQTSASAMPIESPTRPSVERDTADPATPEPQDSIHFSPSPSRPENEKGDVPDQSDASKVGLGSSPGPIVRTVPPLESPGSVATDGETRKPPDSLQRAHQGGITGDSSRIQKPLKTAVGDVVNAPPLVLGQLVAQVDELISWMVVKTYGVFREELLNIVVKSNPHIDDPDLVEGNIISFPAVPCFVDHMKPDYYWIQLDVRDSLQEAFDVLRSYPKSYPNHAPNIGLIPHWSSRDGLMFSIIYKDCFKDELTARHRMNTLPLKLSPQWKIVSTWSKGNIYYSDPYTCRNLATPNLNKG